VRDPPHPAETGHLLPEEKEEGRRCRSGGVSRSRPISRVLSWTTIHLGYASPRISSDLPGSLCGPHVRSDLATGPRASLFGLAPGGVCRAAECYHRRGALLPHPFTLTGHSCERLRRFAFCCTFRGLTSPRRYLAPCPRSPDFPPRLRAAVAWPTPARMVGTRPVRCKRFEVSESALCWPTPRRAHTDPNA
jgi:hypothetical protein